MKIEGLIKKDIQNSQKIIISKIRDLINFKNLEPADKLPSERMLSEKFGVSRSNIREAIQKLEFFGLLESKPQSGTFITNIGVTATNGMIEDILRLEDSDFKSFVETRVLLELKAVHLASIIRSEDNLRIIKEALSAYTKKVLRGEDAVQEDLLFHLAIAKACGNSTINKILLLITPEILINFKKHIGFDIGLVESSIEEYNSIYNAIENQDSQMAEQKMKEHFRRLYQGCYDINSFFTF